MTVPANFADFVTILRPDHFTMELRHVFANERQIVSRLMHVYVKTKIKGLTKTSAHSVAVRACRHLCKFL